MSQVVAVHRSSSHTFSKFAEPEIVLIAGQGVAGDAHLGETVKHRSRVKRDPTEPNLRQVHLIHAELFDELVESGFAVFPGDMGENITTRGIGLLALPEGTQLRIGDQAIVEVTGLRNPCSQIDRFQSGLMQAVLAKANDGSVVRKAGVMAVVLEGGAIRPGDRIEVKLPSPPARPLQPV